MTFDWYTELAALLACPADGRAPEGLALVFVDGCTTWLAVNQVRAAECEERLKGEHDKKSEALEQEKQRHERAKNDARRCYMERAVQGAPALPPELNFDLWPPRLFQDAWLAIAVGFELLTPWYSKDDRLFHVLDNPVRKDRVFGVPHMSAASWKGLLRWACRMQAGLKDHLEQGKRFEVWTDPDWILHLFGNEKGEKKDFQQGALVFYPTWFDKIGFEVINPHDRRRRAGTQPIYYEVVPGRQPKRGDSNQCEEGGKGALRLLYAPWPGTKDAPALKEFLSKLLDAIKLLLTQYGISAKRTVGWGTAEIQKWQAWTRGRAPDQPIEGNDRKQLLRQLLANSGDAT